MYMEYQAKDENLPATPLEFPLNDDPVVTPMANCEVDYACSKSWCNANNPD